MNLNVLKRAACLVAVPLLLFSCNTSKKEKTEIWIGGEIVNPKSDFVILSKGNCVIDTLRLDASNHFMYTTTSLEEGLYSFRHSEFQYFYIQPGDSLLLRVNTMDFDESLTYTGTGADRNNLLMEYFLLNEKEDQKVATWYNLSPEVFEAKVDSLQDIRENIYAEYRADHEVSSNFSQYVEASNEYDIYTMKEYYASVNIKNGKGERIPKEFFSFRKNIDYGNEDLRFFYSYYTFFSPHFDNLVYEKNKGKNQFYDKRSYEHNAAKINLVNEKITNDSLKNNLLRSIARRYLLNEKDSKNQAEMAMLFNNLSTNKAHKQEIGLLSSATISLTPGNKIPEIMIVCSNNETQPLASILKKPTVLYFWSGRSTKHYKEIHLKASELKGKYPEYDFVGINTDTHFKKWRAMIIRSGFNKEYEYQFDNVSEAQRKLVLNSSNKAFIVDKDGVIITSNGNLFTDEMESQLLASLN